MVTYQLAASLVDRNPLVVGRNPLVVASLVVGRIPLVVASLAAVVHTQVALVADDDQLLSLRQSLQQPLQ